MSPRGRLGAVPYLNARPLVYGLGDAVRRYHPAELADRLRRGDLDAGTVPVVEAFQTDQYNLVGGVAIASRGPVQSVFLAHRQPLGRLRRVAVTPVSRTSVWLLRVLLHECHGINPELYPLPPGATLADHEAMLLIGDEAIRYLVGPRAQDGDIWDLGQAWWEWTGLPCVFACWAVRRDRDGAALAGRLRKARDDGLAHLAEIVQDAIEAPPKFLWEYFTRHLVYVLG
ncbi:menaquinone biosynthesis protein, partial [bacterium]|nr:menaquinone biosynthesis protein [bacterium]